MSDDLEKKLKEKLMSGITSKSNVVQFPTRKAINSGDGQVGNNIQQFGEINYSAGGDININQPPKINKTNAVPGAHHITEAQAYQITTLMHEIVEWEVRVKNKPRDLVAVRSAFKSKFKLSNFRFLSSDKYDIAINYLRQDIGRLTNAKSARKSPEWRKKKYAYIHTNCKSQHIKEAMRKYTVQYFNTFSLKELSDDELDKVYKWVAHNKPRNK